MKMKTNISQISLCGVAVLLLSACSEKETSFLTKEAEAKLALLDEKVIIVKKKAKPADEKSGATDLAAENEPKKPTVSKEVLDKAIAGGKTAFVNCIACHQATGKGMAGIFPPLAKSNWVNDLEPKELAKIVIRGLSGPIEVSGTAYGNAPMSPLGAIMNDQQISDVLVYVKNSWGNNGGYISPEDVKEVRAEHAGKPMLTAADIQGLENLK